MGRPSGKFQPEMVKPILHRMGIRGSSGLQRVGGSESGAPSGEEGGVIVVWGRAGSATKDKRKDHIGLMSRLGRRCEVGDEEKFLGTS